MACLHGRLLWRNLGATVLLSSLFLHVACWEHPRWRRADDLVANLECGMTEESVRDLARRYRGLEIYTPYSDEDGWTLAVSKGNTTIYMDVGDAGLQRYQVCWVDTIKHVAFLPQVDLCGAESSREGDAEVGTGAPGPLSVPADTRSAL